MAKPITPTVKGSTIELGFEASVRQALADFAEATQAEKKAKSKRAEAEVILRSFLGNHEFATIGGSLAFKIIHVEDKKEIDRELLKNSYPDVAEKVFYPNPYDFIKAVV